MCHSICSSICACACVSVGVYCLLRGEENEHTLTHNSTICCSTNLLNYTHNILSSSSSSSLSSMIAHLNWLFYYYINLIENQAFAVWQPVGRFAANWQTFAHARTHSSPSSNKFASEKWNKAFCIYANPFGKQFVILI